MKKIYNEQEVYYIYKEKFCTDKDDIIIILIEKRLKIIVIIQENLQEPPIVNVA